MKNSLFCYIFFLSLCFVIISCSRDSNNTNETTDEQQLEEATEPEDVEEPEDSTESTTLIWSDEFEGAALDEEKWTYQRGAWNGSNVQNCYVDENTTVADGVLKITAKYQPGYDCFNTVRDFTSGFVQTKNTINWTYGYFEARVRVPDSDSTWPAFWMSPQEAVYGAWPQSGEIDIFEIRGYDMTKSFGNAHWGISASERRQEKGEYEVGDANNWHVYAVDWVEGELQYYIDGEWYHTINDFRAPNATEHPGPFNIGFFLRLNVAVGGTYLREPYDDANNSINQLPAVMEVDYVRVYSEKPF
jgi:beta-glucanase (GH16 family)